MNTPPDIPDPPPGDSPTPPPGDSPTPPPGDTPTPPPGDTPTPPPPDPLIQDAVVPDASVQGGPARRQHFFTPLSGFVPSFLWGLRLTCTWKRMLLVGSIAVGLAILLGSKAVGAEHLGRPTDAYFDLWEMFDESMLRFMLPIITLVTVARGFSTEVGDRTLVYHLARPIPRATLCVSRFFSGVVPGTILSALTLFALAFASGLELPVGVWLSLPLTALVATLAIGSVYYMFATLLRRGMIAALIYTFVFEPLFSGQRGAMQKLSIMFHVRGVHHGLTDAAFSERSENVALALQPKSIFDLAKVNWADPSAMMELRDRIAYDIPMTATLTVVCITSVLLAFTAWRVSQKDYPLKD